MIVIPILTCFQGMKCSTRVCYCCIFRLQPMYVQHKPKLSMYSNWRVVSKDCHPSGLPATVGLAAYNSICHSSSFGIFSLAGNSSKKMLKTEKNSLSRVDDDQMIVTHSSQWKKLSQEIHEEAEKSKADVIMTNGQNPGDQKVRNFKIFQIVFELFSDL